MKRFTLNVRRRFPKSVGRLAVFAATLTAVSMFAIFTAVIIARPTRTHDFAAFYCAGRALSEHADPYTALALSRCEHSLSEDQLMKTVRNLVVPAPLPPYDLAMLAMLSHLSYSKASLVWGIGMVVAVTVTIIALRAISGQLWVVIVLAIIPIDLVIDIALGQPVPLVVAAITLCAWAVQAGKDRWAAVFAGCAMIEPHIGLPVCLAILFYRPAARPILLAAALVALFGSSAFAPPALNVEYLRQILPSHALAEVTWFLQYSLTHALWVMGMPAHAALYAGTLSYFAMLCIGLWTAPRLAAKLRAPALLVAYPAALAVFGGTYIHIAQVPAALPSAMIIAVKGSGWPRVGAAVALVLLTYSVPQILDLTWAVFTLVIAAVLTIFLLARRPLIAAGALALMVGMTSMSVHSLPAAITRAFNAQIAPTVGKTALADDPWQRYAIASDPGPGFQRIAEFAKAPTFLGLVLIFCGGISAAFGTTRRTVTKGVSQTSVRRLPGN